MILATVDLASAGGALAGIGGLGVLLLGLAKLRGEKESSTVSMQSTILGDMKILNEELVDATERMRSERDRLLTLCEELRVERNRLSTDANVNGRRADTLEQLNAVLRADKVTLEDQLAALRVVAAQLRSEIHQLQTSR